MKLEKIMLERKIQIAIILTKKKLKGTKELDEYILIYSCVSQNIRARAGIPILIYKSWKSRIESYSFITKGVMSLRFRISTDYLTTIRHYAPEEGKKEEKQDLYKLLQKRIDRTNKHDHLLVCGDSNAIVSNTPIPGIRGSFGENTLNNNENELIQFASTSSLKISNTFFRKRDVNKYTWSSRGYKTIIEYFLINEKLKSLIKDVQVCRGCD